MQDATPNKANMDARRNPPEPTHNAQAFSKDDGEVCIYTPGAPKEWILASGEELER